MKDVVLVTAYTPDDERLQLLIDCINFLFENDKDIILVTHSTNTPEYIQKKCKFYLYSSENKLLDSPETKTFYNRYSSDLFFGSKLVSGYKHTALAIYNMLYLGMSTAKILGYDIVHYVEYDSRFKTTNLFDYSLDKLQEGYDVFYGKTPEGEMYGGFFSARLSSFDFSELVYDENKLIEEFKKHLVTERLTRDYLFAGKKIFTIDCEKLSNLGYALTQFIHFSKENPYVFPVLYEDYIQIVHDNQNSQDEKLLVILNDNQIFTGCTKPSSFVIFPISRVEDTKKITIMINDKLVSIYETDTEEKINHLIKNSFVSKN